MVIQALRSQAKNWKDLTFRKTHAFRINCESCDWIEFFSDRLLVKFNTTIVHFWELPAATLTLDTDWNGLEWSFALPDVELLSIALDPSQNLFASIIQAPIKYIS